MPYPERFTFERYIYEPNGQVGKYCYDIPCATNEVYEQIGQKGIDEINAIMKTMLETRKKMFGCAKEEFYGFSGKEVFFDLETTICIKLIANPDMIKSNLKFVEAKYPELLKHKESYLLMTYYAFEKNLGKIAFKNRVRDTLNGFYTNSISPREKTQNAVDSVRWLKAHRPSKLLSVLQE